MMSTDVTSPSIAPEPSPRARGGIGDVLGAMFLHLPLLIWVLLVTSYLVYLEGIPDTPALIYLGGGVVVWLALGGVLVALWSRGRQNLWEVPLAWLLIASFTYLVLPLLFWPRCRKWLIRSCVPSRQSFEGVTTSRVKCVTQVGILLLVASALVYGPLIVMAAAGLIGEHTYTWQNISFSYPSEFRQTAAAQSDPPEGQLSVVGFSYRGDRDSGVYFQVLALEIPEGMVTDGDIPDALIEELIKEAQQSSGFQELVHSHIAGLPAIGATTPKATHSFAGADVWFTQTWIIDLKAQRTYIVMCQYRDQHRAQVAEACDRVFETFKVKD